MTNVKNILRWVAVLPVAVFSSFIGYAIIIVYGWVAKWFNGEAVNEITFTDIITFFGANIIMGCAPIFAGSMVAPYRKRETAVVLTFLFSILTAYSITLEISNHGVSKTFWGIIIGLVSAIISCIQIMKGESGEKTKS